jgi:hypothetical protein
MEERQRCAKRKKWRAQARHRLQRRAEGREPKEDVPRCLARSAGAGVAGREGKLRTKVPPPLQPGAN